METAEKTIASTEEVGAVSMSPSTSLLGVEYRLERVRHNIVSTWDKGTLQRCEEELAACREELATFLDREWRIVRIERHLVTPNARLDGQEKQT